MCTKVIEEALNAVKFYGWLKKFEPAQDILGLVKGQGRNGQHGQQIYEWTLYGPMCHCRTFLNFT